MRPRAEALFVLALALAACSSPAGVEDGAPEGRFDASEAHDTAPPPLDEAVDLLPWLRLAASGVHVPEGMPWVREARDAVATLRDGHDDTGWWVPQGAPSWLEIDLQPAFGAPLALERFSLVLGGTPPPDVTVELREACGADVSASLAWSDPGEPLDLGGRIAGCLRLTWTAPGDLRVLEAALTSRDGHARATLERPAATPAGANAFADHGVVEGFYGVPWSWRERRNLLRMLAAGGLSAYVYAPKDDPLHRDRWREPYGAPALSAFADLARQAEELGLTFLFGVSPLIDFDFASEADHQALLGKLRPLLEAGASGACLLADDIELEAAVEVGAELGAAHVALANRLLADLRALRADARLWFVPTVYSDARRDGWAGGPAYLEALRALEPGIPVLWTGTDTFSPELAAADLAAVTAALGRAPLIWDNFWANDGGDGFFGRLLLGPLTGRTSDLPGAVGGCVQNPSIQGASSRLALGTYAHWLADPGAYGVAGARSAALEAELAFAFGAGRSAAVDRELLGRLFAIFDASTLDTPRYRALADAVASLVSALGEPGLPVAEGGVLLGLLAGMAVLPAELHHSGLDADLVDDVAIPTDKARIEGELGLAALALLGERLAGREGAAELAEARAAAQASKANRYLQEPRLEEALLRPIGAVEGAGRGFVAPAPGASAPSCVAGQRMEWRPFEGAAAVEVAGLPGAEAAGDGLRWTPPHAGVFPCVVVATGPSGWAWRREVLSCRPR